MTVNGLTARMWRFNSCWSSILSIRAEQKLRTRRALMDAALALLSADRGFGSLSLREVAREAGIAPTSFYRHFAELDELGLALVDEGGVALRQLMRQARKRIARDGSAISTSVDTFMEYLGKKRAQDDAGGFPHHCRSRAIASSGPDHFSKFSLGCSQALMSAMACSE